MIDVLHLIVQWCKTFLPSLLPSIVSMNDSWFLSSWIVNPKLFQGENYKPNSLPFEAWIATTYFLIAALSLIFAVSSTFSGACSYFVFDLCCFFNNLRRLQLLFLWSSLLFLPQFQALAAASSLIFAVSSTTSGRLKLLLILIFAVSSTISGSWTCFFCDIWCFFDNLKCLQLLPVGSLLFLQQHQGLKLQISSISLLNPWLLVSLTLLDARLGQVSTALIHLRLKNYLNEQLTQRPGEETRPQHASY